MLFPEPRREIADLGRQLEGEGLLSLTAGNISARVRSDRIAITPTNIPYPQIRPEDVVVVDLEGRPIDGDRRPSSELPMHLTLYRARPDAGGIVHTHSLYATTLAVLGMRIPAVHYMIAGLGVDEVPLVEYATFGTDDLAEHVRASIGEHARAALLANHGAIALGSNLLEAATAAAVLEFLATIYYRALAVGQPVVLSKSEIALVSERYERHGQMPAVASSSDEA